ncbi:hypothetical protein VTN31DRAFT_2023 [Thermomyces dupontii]|uniref:uncharacterized protein n=1 Tax=Talaromyces thermophilus TaxID=28565 RepID=UPI003742A802
MWLDRLSGHSSPSGTPPPNSRSYSPARRPARLPRSQSLRSTLHPRSSSTSLLLSPDDSTTSLPGTARSSSNGTASRPAQSRQQPTGVSDPLEVLNSIIGRKAPEKSAETTVEKPAQLVESIDFGGLSLEQFALRGTEPGGIVRSDDGAQAIQQFECEQDKYQELHNAIADCDEVLKSVESYLNDFQNELGAVSAEIESLQARSIQLNAKLENRRNVERLLGPAVEEISISPKAVRAIVDGPIDENWVKALNEVEARSASIEKSSASIKALDDLRPLLADLKTKAVVRIRDYLVAQIKALRSPNINAQIIQQQNFLKYKDLYSYLYRAHPTLTEEITQAYVNTMRWYYISHFTRYSQALGKLRLHQSDQNNVLGGDASQRSAHTGPARGFSAFDPFTLGRRIDILKTTNHMAMGAHVAEEDKSVHGFEVPFRHFNLALIDNVSAEYSFMAEMFSVKSFQQISRRAIEIFEPVFTLGQNMTKSLIDNTTDCLGVLLCVRLNQQAAFELQRRRVPVADSYINGINMQLWPRFQQIMDLHCESLKKVASTASRSGMSTLSLTSDDATQSSAPHFLTQRFGQLVHGILSLSNEAGDDEPVSNSLGRLTAEFDSLLAKLSRGLGDPKRRERFLYNNYSLILTIISDTNGKLATEQKEHFNEMLQGVMRR